MAAKIALILFLLGGASDYGAQLQRAEEFYARMAQGCEESYRRALGYCNYGDVQACRSRAADRRAFCLDNTARRLAHERERLRAAADRQR